MRAKTRIFAPLMRVTLVRRCRGRRMTWKLAHSKALSLLIKSTPLGPRSGDAAAPGAVAAACPGRRRRGGRSPDGVVGGAGHFKSASAARPEPFERASFFPPFAHGCGSRDHRNRGAARHLLLGVASAELVGLLGSRTKTRSAL